MTFDKFTIKAQEAIQEAVNLVQARGQPVSYTHLAPSSIASRTAHRQILPKKAT